MERWNVGTCHFAFNKAIFGKINRAMKAAALSQYEIEHDKPVPGFNHRILQMRMGVVL